MDQEEPQANLSSALDRCRLVYGTRPYVDVTHFWVVFLIF